MAKNADKRFRSSILKALASYKNAARGIEEGQALDAIAMELVKSAVDRKDEKFEYASKTIIERLDGKATEHIEVESSDTTTFVTIGISESFAKLSEITNQRPAIDGEIAVQDRPVLSPPIRLESDRRGETVGIRQDQGSPAKPE